MQPLYAATTIPVLYALVRAADVAISAAIVRDYIRAVIYGIVAILALIATIFILFIH